MDPVFRQLLILMIVVWTVAVALRRIGLPTVMGELVMGVILGPAVLGWVKPSEIIDVLAQLGVFFIMLHTGVKTEPREFFSTLKVSLGVAIVGAIVPFSVAYLVARSFGLDMMPAIFCGLTMTATAVVVTLKILKDLKLDQSRAAHIIVASSIFDAVLTLIFFSVVLGIVREGAVDPVAILFTSAKATAFFVVVIVIGRWLYPFFKHPFRRREGKGFAFVLVLGLAFGLFAEAIGLHIIVGAYLAGLFFREEVASRDLIQKVEDRLDSIAYTLLGPIFFISLGFHITFDALSGIGLWFVIILTTAVAIGQILSAGGMARLVRCSWSESLTVGIGMCGRAEMAFVLASIGLSMGTIDTKVFSVLIFTTFLLNIFASAGLWGVARQLKR
jgi:Kef-type K+ transport system membrane component KefB